MVEMKWAKPEVRKSPDMELAALLRERPGEWGIIREEAWSSVVTGLRSGRYAGFRPPGEFEFRFQTSKAENRNVGTIFARYVGPVGGDAA